MRLLIAALTLSLAATPTLAGECLNMKDATSTHFKNDRVMTVQTKQKRNYTITFRNRCAAHQYPLTYFVYEQWTLQCVNRGSVFPTNDKGPCFVQSVSQS